MIHLIEAINGGKKVEYEKDFMKIKFNSHQFYHIIAFILQTNIHLNKMLKLHLLTVIVRSVFEEDASYYPQVFLDECLSVV